MEYVHLQSIVHRDLKPQNLHVDQNGRVKLVDFGIAKSVEWNKTQAGLVKGTAYYMAPEQIMGNPVTFRTDIWAFGVVLFEMLSGGKRPFQGSTLDTLWAAIVNGTPTTNCWRPPVSPNPCSKSSNDAWRNKRRTVSSLSAK